MTRCPGLLASGSFRPHTCFLSRKRPAVLGQGRIGCTAAAQQACGGDATSFPVLTQRDLKIDDQDITIMILHPGESRTAVLQHACRHIPRAAGLASMAWLLPASPALAAIHTEPANALSLPTWAVHVSSTVEWGTAMYLFWRYAEVTGRPPLHLLLGAAQRVVAEGGF